MDPSTPVSGTAVAPAAVRTRGRALGRESLAGYVFLAPGLAILLVFLLIPAVWVLGLSFFRWDLISSNADFIGSFNYERMFLRDSVFWQALWQTFYFVAVSVPLGMALGLGLALLLNARLPARGLLRAIVFSPYVTPMVATLVTWQYIFNNDYGVLNAVLHALHLPRVGWLVDSRAMMPAIILYSLWWQSGYVTVIFLAGLSQIPAEMEEAARVDGAGTWNVFRHVTWPLLTPTTYFVLLISMIGAFKVFAQSYVLAGSGVGTGAAGPNRAALTLGLYLYQQGFQFFRAGYASAISVVLFAIILAITLVQMRVTARRVFYR